MELRRTVGSLPLVGPASLHARAAAKVLRQRPSIRAAIAPLDDRLVFVLGSPRSGTTFLATAVGSLPGFVDLGEVLPLKAALPSLAGLDADTAAARLRRILWPTRRLGGAAGLRAVEQTPEVVFAGPALVRAFPRATILHVVRDGRDVVCSLLERGWLSAGRPGHDDAGGSYGDAPRFWVERGREDEFRSAGDACRAAWAWRRYVETGRALGAHAHELRYERVCTDPNTAAEDLAGVLNVAVEPIRQALGPARASSIGRFRRDLTPEQLAEVEAEAGPLLRELGYSAGEMGFPPRAPSQL